MLLKHFKYFVGLVKPITLGFGQFNALPPEDYCIPAAFTPDDGCPYGVKSNVSHLIFIKQSYQFTDMADSLEWGTAIGTGDVLIIPVRGKMATPEAVKVDGVGNSKSRTISYSWSIEALGNNPDANMTMGRRLEKLGAYAMIVVFEGNNRGWGIVTRDGASTKYKTISMSNTPTFEGEERQMKYYGEWDEFLNPILADIPAGIITN